MVAFFLIHTVTVVYLGMDSASGNIKKNRLSLASTSVRGVGFCSLISSSSPPNISFISIFKQ